MSASQKKITIGQREYWVSTDPGYGKHLGERFEPNTVALLECLSGPDFRIIDIGANIGITGVLLAQLAPEGRVAAIEPVPTTYRLLETNVADSGHKNIQTHNFALGKDDGEIVMQGNPDNLSGAFVSDIHSIDDHHHFKEVVKLHALDSVFGTLGLDRLDLIKIDVEGYELDVLEGGASVLAKYRPIVTLEMNYVALNLWRKISVPEFRERLLDIFPFVYAVNEGEYIDFRDERRSHDILFQHLTKWDFMDIVAGFDNDVLTNRLDRLDDICEKNANQYLQAQEQASQSHEPQEVTLSTSEMQEIIDRLEEDLDSEQKRSAIWESESISANARLHAIEESHSWMITAPLRGLARSFRKH